VYIHGLFLEGCRISKNGLEDSEPKKMFSDLPVVLINAELKGKSKDADKGNTVY
jgi:dynein heavy chain